MNVSSPFRISSHDEDYLNRSHAFQTVREHLRRQELGRDAPSFCSLHRDCSSPQEQQSFRLHRDIIHTLLLPLFLLHNQASQVASSVLPSQRAAEPERAFRGEARSAYSWLHCILTEEHDSYMTERCPTCIVSHVLHSEPTIRFVAVACLLSEHFQALEAGSPQEQLPSFEFWFEALESAVREDPFWGDDFWPDIEYRACTLTDGVKQLVLQCWELRAALSRQTYESSSLYERNGHYRCGSQQQINMVVVDSPTTLARKHARMTNKDQSVAPSNCSLQSQWVDRSQRLNSRRHSEVRRRSVTS